MFTFRDELDAVLCKRRAELQREHEGTVVFVVNDSPIASSLLKLYFLTPLLLE